VKLGGAAVKYRMLTIVAATLLLTCLFMSATGETSFHQYFVLRKARAHQSVLREAFAKDPRFALVDSARSTGGWLIITGSVPNRPALDNLKRTIEETRPPVDVRYSVEVQESPR